MLLVGVGNVAQAVTDEVEGEHREHHEQGRNQQPWMQCHGTHGLRLLRITPQLTTGGRSPMPMKLSAVSPRIMPGTARVTLAIR